MNTFPGLEDLPDSETLPGYAEPNEYVPTRDPNYIFLKEDVRVMVGHLRNDSPEGLMLVGPKGSGKSSLVHQMYAYLNRPLFHFTGSRTAEFEDMLGTKEIVDGDTITLDGPLVQAWTMPYAGFLNEEIDRSPSSVSVALNPLLDGYDLIHTLDSGRRIRRSEGVRFMSTGNTNGQGDMTGDYNSANVMDTSFLDRNWCHEVWYAPPEHELLVLRKAVEEEIGEEPLRRSIKLANDVRYLYTGRDNEVSTSGQAVGGSGRIHVTFSTRALMMLWRVMALFPNVEQPIIYALKLVITNKCTPECAEAICKLAEAHFGDS
ncbi:MAG TPA: AAA family ATPase [Opitutaceae bacterium]|nr:AAA family ATPase [Opitutaceae bacterium]